jgi:GTP-binding protein LepA
VGYIITGIKNAKEVKVGDTITLVQVILAERINGFEDVKPMVFAGIFPVETDDI